MCIYVFLEWCGCDHTQFIGSQHCGMENTKVPEHQNVSNYFLCAGYDCGICRAQNGVDLDPKDVKFYAATNLKVTVIDKPNSFSKTIVSRPQHRRNWNSLSDSGSEGSCSSITARMCGIDVTAKNKSKEAPVDVVTAEHDVSSIPPQKNGAVGIKSPIPGPRVNLPDEELASLQSAIIAKINAGFVPASTNEVPITVRAPPGIRASAEKRAKHRALLQSVVCEDPTSKPHRTISLEDPVVKFSRKGKKGRMEQVEEDASEEKEEAKD